jgi:hypothetical protein
MPTTQVRIPKLCKHKATGQAVVRLDGKDHYLGKFGTAAAMAAYERLIAEWLAHGRRLPDARSGPTVNELILGYWRRCQEHYRKADGSPSSELDLVRLTLRPLKQLYGRTPGAKFGPLALKAVRQRMIDTDLSRGVINAHVSRIKRLFKWAVENELVPPVHPPRTSGGHGTPARAVWRSRYRAGQAGPRSADPSHPVPCRSPGLGDDRASAADRNATRGSVHDAFVRPGHERARVELPAGIAQERVPRLRAPDFHRPEGAGTPEAVVEAEHPGVLVFPGRGGSGSERGSQAKASYSHDTQPGEAKAEKRPPQALAGALRREQLSPRDPARLRRGIPVTGAFGPTALAIFRCCLFCSHRGFHGDHVESDRPSYYRL